MKKIIALISFLCIAVLCTGCMSAGAGSEPIVEQTDVKNEEMKIGRYYREGGTEEQYIEIYEGFQIQLFGFDLYQRTVDMNKGYIEGLSEEEREYTLNEIKKDAELREARLFYQREPVFRAIVFKQTSEYVENIGGECLSVLDENTIQFDKDEIYIYEGATE